MKGIRIVCVGKVKEAYFRDGIDYYVREIRRNVPIEIVECPDEPTPDGASKAVEDQIRHREGEKILAKISCEDYVCALCIEGKQSEDEKWISNTKKTMKQVNGWYTFVIGGSLGLSPQVVRRADEKLSFSAMTFPHQMMRMILCEHLSRLTEITAI